MARRIAVLVLAVLVGVTSHAYGQNGGNERRSTYAPIVLPVVCGKLSGPACGQVLPRIAARTMQAGLELKPMESGGAFDTAASVCNGQAAAAIVQRDAVVQLAYAPACQGRFDVAGRSLYSYYAFLVVKAGAPFRTLNDLANAGQDGRKRAIAVGAEGSGGQITFGFLSRADPVLQRDVEVTSDDGETALRRIADGSIDGFFTMETLNSGLINQVRMKTDASGKPFYTFIDVRPGPDFTRAGDGAGHCLYRLTALDFGGTLPVTTVSVDAVMVVGREFRDAHARSGPRASDALASAIEQTRDAILADMKSPRDWRPAGTSCQ